ncbi:4183_t:CDS:2, partial [Ambispora leptoticha]
MPLPPRKKQISLVHLFDDLESSEEEQEDGRVIVGDTWKSFPKEEENEAPKALVLTRQNCSCADCEKVISPEYRPDFEPLKKIFNSEKLLRHAAMFAGTRKITEKIIDHFHNTWGHPLHMGCPDVQYVTFMKCDKKLCQRWDEYISELALFCSNNNPNVKALWHGTSVRCNIEKAQGPCNPSSKESCASCNILTSGFDISKSGTANSFKRFGTGIYFASNSSKAHSYATPRGNDDTYTILFCFVALGRCHSTENDQPYLTEPPYPCHSVHGIVGSRLNFEEFVVYRGDAVIPFAAVSYRMKN